MKSKKNVRESWFIFAIVMLSIALALSIYLFLQNPFITNKPAHSGLIPLGTPLNIKVDAVGATTQSVFFKGSVLPNSVVRQDVKITLNAAQENAVARAKVFMFNEKNQLLPINAQTANIWDYSEDGYYYCQEVFTPNLVLDFLQAVEIPDTNFGLNAENVYALLVSVEALPLTADFKSIWKLN